jgi:hypothetical protein
MTQPSINTSITQQNFQTGGFPLEYYNTTDTFIQQGGSFKTLKSLKKIVTLAKLKKFCDEIGIISSRSNIKKIKTYISTLSLFILNEFRQLVKNKKNLIGKVHIQKVKKTLKTKSKKLKN